MARLKNRASEAGLREFLLEEAVYIRDTLGAVMPEAFAVFSREADRLVGGEAYTFDRYELPDGHPLRRVGGMYDRLVLTADDELLCAGTTAIPA